MAYAYMIHRLYYVSGDNGLCRACQLGLKNYKYKYKKNYYRAYIKKLKIK